MRKSVLTFLIMAAAGSVYGMAENTSTYLSDSEKLKADMHKIEMTLNGQVTTQERDGVEKLKWRLADIRDNHSAYENLSGFNQAFTMASNNNWVHVIAALDKIKTACTASTTAGDNCFIELSSFDDFVDSRNMSDANKIFMKSSIDSYSKHLQAKLLLNEKFIRETDALLNEYRNVLTKPEMPLVTVKIEPAKSAPMVAIQKLAAARIPEQPMAFSWWWVGAGAALILGAAGNIMRKRIRAKRVIRDFYGRIFFKVRKNTYKTKIFGNIQLQNSRKAVKIETEYLNFVSTIDSLKANVDIKFKNRDKKLVIETLVYTSNPIQEFIKTDETKTISKSIADLESRVFALGGEVSISNLIDQTGKIVNSSITLTV